MKCPRCGTDNPETRKFCRECGGKLLLLCPKCGSENLPGDKFCGECGHDLSLSQEPPPRELTFDEKLDKIQRYLPRGLTQKILSHRDKIEGERKQVTVMFCDMAGFTSLTERLGPEKAYQVMDQVYEILIHKVHDYEGTVNEMTGDGIMALFGAPIALEDAPQRALRSAQAIHREMARFGNQMEQELKGTGPLKMRIGIHSGPVVVGTLGNNLRVEFKAVGETVNLASRMEGLAEPGTTYVTEDTFKLTEGLFRFEALGKREIKGKSGRVAVYRALGAGRSRSRFEARAEKGLTRFIGRERETEILWDCLQRVKEGRGQALSIVSEAGLGKSRLLYEFRKALINEDVTFLEGRCASYGQSSPYLPVIDVLKENFRIESDDGPKEIQEKVRRGLRQIGEDLDEKLPYLSELFSLENGFAALKGMDPESKRRRTFETIKDLTLKGSQVRPLIMAIEDLHWIDKTSEESLKLLIDQITGARVFLIFTFRSNYVPPWGGRSYYSQVTLNRLSNRESLQMIQSVLNADEIEEGLARVILERAEGIPFFVEELTRSLSESGAVVREGGRCRLNPDVGPVRIPEMLLDLIMARVDRLPEGAKEVLQIGSVIEREFGWPLLKELTGISDEELLSRFSYAKEAELVFERGIFPRTTYVFQHALTQEVLYNSLLSEKRQEIHRTIGNSMEKLHGDRLEEHLPVLAVHFTRGGDLERGYQYRMLAGERAASAFANKEALEHFQEAWRLLDEMGRSQEVEKRRLDTAVKLAEVMEPLGMFEPTLSVLGEALGAWEGLEDPASLARVQFWMGNTFGNLGRYDEAREHLFRALELSRKSGAKETEGLCHNYFSQLDFFQGYYKRGLEHGDAAVECLSQTGNWYRATWSFLFRAVIEGALKSANESDGIFREAETWVERTGNDRTRCLLHTLIEWIFVRYGDYESVYKAAIEGLSLADKIGEGIQAVFSLAYGALGAFYTGHGDAALALLERGRQAGEKIGHPLGNALLDHASSEILLRLGRMEAAVEPAQRALAFFQDLDMGYLQLKALGINAEILAAQPDPDEQRICDMMKQSEALCLRGESLWDQADHWMTWCRIHERLGRWDAARESLLKAKALYAEMGLENGTVQLRSLEEALKA